MPSRKRSDEQARVDPRPMTGSVRTRNVASSATTSTVRGLLTDGLRASTTMNANEIGRRCPERRSQLEQLASSDGAADQRERRPRAARAGRSRARQRPTRLRRRAADAGPALHVARRLLLGARGRRARPIRSRPPGARPPSRARRPRGRRRSCSPRRSIAAMSASTHWALNCVPAPSRSSSNAVSCAQRTPVRAGRGHGVERVGDVDDRRLDQRRIARHRRGRSFGGRVTGDRREEVDAAQQLDRHRLVPLHTFELGLGQATGLVEQLVGNDQLADVVHQTRRSGVAPCGAARSRALHRRTRENIATRCA